MEWMRIFMYVIFRGVCKKGSAEFSLLGINIWVCYTVCFTEAFFFPLFFTLTGNLGLVFSLLCWNHHFVNLLPLFMYLSPEYLDPKIDLLTLEKNHIFEFFNHLNCRLIVHIVLIYKGLFFLIGLFFLPYTLFLNTWGKYLLLRTALHFVFE